MASANTLISPRVVIGFAEQRLAELADQIAQKRAHRCVVLDSASRRFLGVVRLAELAARSQASGRILADLISAVAPLVVPTSESADAVATLLEQHDVDEAVITEGDGRFVGLITKDSVFAWLRTQVRPAVESAPLGPKNPAAIARAHALAAEQALSREFSEEARKSFRDIATLLAAEVSVPLTPAQPTGGEAGTILLVEDHQPSRAALAAFLRRRGYLTMEAGSAQQALELAGQHRIDLVVSDIGLPDGSGQQLIARLRELHGLNGIAVSAYGSREDIAASKSSGFMLHVTKPVAGDALEKILASYFAMERTGSRATRPG